MVSKTEKGNNHNFNLIKYFQMKGLKEDNVQSGEHKSINMNKNIKI